MQLESSVLSAQRATLVSGWTCCGRRLVDDVFRPPVYRDFMSSVHMYVDVVRTGQDLLQIVLIEVRGVHLQSG